MLRAAMHRLKRLAPLLAGAPPRLQPAPLASRNAAAGDLAWLSAFPFGAVPCVAQPGAPELPGARRR